MTYGRRLLRARLLEALDTLAKQFRSRDELQPFRVPHQPVDLHAFIEDALVGYPGTIDPPHLRSRTIVRFDWDDGSGWEAWAITLPSGLFLYCDSSHDETRVLASVKRGSAEEADRFFLELLAESAGEHFGIEMSGGAPDRVRTLITDRAFLTDIFVDLFEGRDAERSVRKFLTDTRQHSIPSLTSTAGPASEHRANSNMSDFRSDVERWLDRVLVTPTPPKARRKRAPKRLRDEEPR